MLTPQEVSEHAFAKASFGGYNMSMVDEFLDSLTADYTALYKENAVLKNKMKVLVDKVEEYRTTEDAMRKALLTAQRMADEMVQEAEQKKVALLAQAEDEARRRTVDLQREIGDEAHRLAVAKDNTADFLAKLRALCIHEAEFLDKFAQLSAPVPPPADPVVSAARDIEDAMQTMARQEAPAPRPEPAPAAPQPVPAAVGARSEPPAPPIEDLLAGLDYLTADAADYTTEDDRPGGLYDDITSFSVQSKTGEGMQQKQFEITLGGPKPPRAEPAPAAVPPVDEPTKRIDFDHLQFGRDYEIK